MCPLLTYRHSLYLLRLKALKAEAEAKRMEQMELEKAAAMLEAVQVSDDQAEDNKSGQCAATAKEEAPIPPSTASTKATTATGRKKKK